jgi:hypothetical protein
MLTRQVEPAADTRPRVEHALEADQLPRGVVGRARPRRVLPQHDEPGVVRVDRLEPEHGSRCSASPNTSPVSDEQPLTPDEEGPTELVPENDEWRIVVEEEER